MNLLLLGPYGDKLRDFLTAFEDTVLITTEQLTIDSECFADIDFIISYGYRYILDKNIVDRFKKKIINLHISLLPWNRGADPNLWSFLEDTPKGVTIHYINQGVDTGNILAQKEVNYLPEDTLRTSYNRLSENIEDLFREVWPLIRSGQREASPQSQGGSFHSSVDKNKYAHLLTNGWDTPVINLVGKALIKG